MYGFPRRLRSRVDPYRFTRYFDARNFGVPVGWWSVDSVRYDAKRAVVMLLDKSGHAHLQTGTPVPITMTDRGPALFIHNSIFSGAWIAPTGNNERTIVFVYRPLFDRELSMNIFWYNNFCFLFYNSNRDGPRGYKVYPQMEYYPPWYGAGYLHLGVWPGSFEVITFRYDGLQLEGYINGALVAANTVNLNTGYGDFSIGSFDAGYWIQPSRYHFFECVVYPHALDANMITTIAHLMLAQYRV